VFILARRISPYDGTDPLFLGLFTDAVRASQAREAYLASVSSTDPWREQSYRQVNLEKDVVTIEIEDRRTDLSSGVVFLVTSNYDGIGQASRRFEAVFSDWPSANDVAIELEGGPFESAPNFCDVDEVVLNAPR
jgi:hypothetical protein